MFLIFWEKIVITRWLNSENTVVAANWRGVGEFGAWEVRGAGVGVREMGEDGGFRTGRRV
jgi:hypothetical protein